MHARYWSDLEPVDPHRLSISVFTRAGDAGLWHAGGEMVRATCSLRKDDDDWRQARTLVRDVVNAAERDRLVENVAGHLAPGVSPRVLERALRYWRQTDKAVASRTAEKLGAHCD